MTEILPAILPRDYEDLKNKIAMVKGLVPMAQVDLCDGVFVPSITWPFASKGGEVDVHFKNILNESEGMPFWQEIDFELDLMVRDAVENFDLYSKLGAKRILFHLEAVGDVEEFRNFLEGLDPYLRGEMEIGVAFVPSTPLSQIDRIANLLDGLQVMGNDKIGYQGVSLDEKTYDILRELRTKYPEMPLCVDIGVSDLTAPRLVAAGATRLAAGSAIFKADDIIGAIERLRSL